MVMVSTRLLRIASLLVENRCPDELLTCLLMMKDGCLKVRRSGHVKLKMRRRSLLFVAIFELVCHKFLLALDFADICDS